MPPPLWSNAGVPPPRSICRSRPSRCSGAGRSCMHAAPRQVRAPPGTRVAVTHSECDDHAGGAWEGRVELGCGAYGRRVVRRDRGGGVGRRGQAAELLKERSPPSIRSTNVHTVDAQLDVKVVSDTVAVEPLRNKPPPYWSTPLRHRHVPFAVRDRRDRAPRDEVCMRRRATSPSTVRYTRRRHPMTVAMSMQEERERGEWCWVAARMVDGLCGESEAAVSVAEGRQSFGTREERSPSVSICSMNVPRGSYQLLPMPSWR